MCVLPPPPPPPPPPPSPPPPPPHVCFLSWLYSVDHKHGCHCLLFFSNSHATCGIECYSIDQVCLLGPEGTHLTPRSSLCTDALPSTLVASPVLYSMESEDACYDLGAAHAHLQPWVISLLPVEQGVPETCPSLRGLLSDICVCGPFLMCLSGW